jgi:hypothetical protein
MLTTPTMPRIKRNTQPIHKSYPELCTQRVDNSVGDIGRNGGKSVGNAVTNGKRAQHPVGYPRFPHTGCAQNKGADLGRRRYPQYPLPL